MGNNRFLLYISLLLLSIDWANAQDFAKLRRFRLCLLLRRQFHFM